MVSGNLSAAMDECEKNLCCRMFFHDATDHPNVFGYCDESAVVYISSEQDMLYKKGNKDVIFCDLCT